ncbi:unnamed protein product [Euphydryas editha]|uniref:Non-structural maintenance of chromosomes element 4 n=1 Tax=Euphydryas editha TaxID=104508 RepID=A0AAU9TGG4_EUPED|nr:unnamed protein product [Euphydryas editha]
MDKLSKSHVIDDIVTTFFNGNHDDFMKLCCDIACSKLMDSFDSSPKLSLLENAAAAAANDDTTDAAAATTTTTKNVDTVFAATTFENKERNRQHNNSESNDENGVTALSFSQLEALKKIRKRQGSNIGKNVTILQIFIHFVLQFYTLNEVENDRNSYNFDIFLEIAANRHIFISEFDLLGFTVRVNEPTGLPPPPKNYSLLALSHAVRARKE